MVLQQFNDPSGLMTNGYRIVGFLSTPEFTTYPLRYATNNLLSGGLQQPRCGLGPFVERAGVGKTAAG